MIFDRDFPGHRMVTFDRLISIVDMHKTNAGLIGNEMNSNEMIMKNLHCRGNFSTTEKNHCSDLRIRREFRMNYE